MSLTHRRWYSNQSLPSPYSRERALSYNTHFMGGLLVNSPKYGMMPWWDSCLSWCDPITRQLAYAAKHEGQDTHAILEIPNGLPLYNENNQFYSPDKFGPLDWTEGETTLTKDFDNLLFEILENDFAFHIAMDERQDHSTKIIQLVAQRLKDLGLTDYGFTMPGYDGVFPTWPPSAITNWGAIARSINPSILLGLEFDPGELPLGNDTIDYGPDGGMKDFDILLCEANSFGPGIGPAGDPTWQEVARCVHPYNRPFDQPSWDDPNPPFVLIDSARGRRYFCYFETDDPYNWVRINPNDPIAVQAARNRINYMRNYTYGLGCSHTG